MKSSDVIARITGRSCGSVTSRTAAQRPAPSTAAASCSSSGMLCSPASSVIVVCGMPAQTPTTMTAGSAVVKSPSQLMLVSRADARGSVLVEHAGVAGG